MEQANACRTSARCCSLSVSSVPYHPNRSICSACRLYLASITTTVSLRFKTTSGRRERCDPADGGCQLSGTRVCSRLPTRNSRSDAAQRPWPQLIQPKPRRTSPCPCAKRGLSDQRAPRDHVHRLSSRSLEAPHGTLWCAKGWRCHSELRLALGRRACVPASRASSSSHTRSNWLTTIPAAVCPNSASR